MAYVHLRNITGQLVRSAMRSRCPSVLCTLSTHTQKNRNGKSDNYGVKYEFLSKQRVMEAATLITEEFPKHNPMIRYLRIPEEVFHQRNIAMLQHVMDSGMVAVCAIETRSNDLVGVATGALISNSDHFERLHDPTMCEEFSPARLLSRKLVDMFFSLPEVRKLQSQGQQFLSLDTSVTKESYRRTGILTYFVNWAIDIARSKEMRILFARTTSVEAEIFCKSFGFKELGEILYGEFEIDGVKAFRHIDLLSKRSKIFAIEI